MEGLARALQWNRYLSAYVQNGFLRFLLVDDAKKNKEEISKLSKRLPVTDLTKSPVKVTGYNREYVTIILYK